MSFLDPGKIKRLVYRRPDVFQKISIPHPIYNPQTQQYEQQAVPAEEFLEITEQPPPPLFPKIIIPHPKPPQNREKASLSSIPSSLLSGLSQLFHIYPEKLRVSAWMYVNSEDEYGNTPLLQALIMSDLLESSGDLLYLLNARADIHHVNHDQLTALSYAFSSTSAEMVALLVTYHANIFQNLTTSQHVRETPPASPEYVEAYQHITQNRLQRQTQLMTIIDEIKQLKKSIHDDHQLRLLTSLGVATEERPGPIHHHPDSQQQHHQQHNDVPVATLTDIGTSSTTPLRSVTSSGDIPAETTTEGMTRESIETETTEGDIPPRGDDNDSVQDSHDIDLTYLLNRLVLHNSDEHTLLYTALLSRFIDPTTKFAMIYAMLYAEEYYQYCYEFIHHDECVLSPEQYFYYHHREQLDTLRIPSYLLFEDFISTSEIDSILEEQYQAKMSQNQLLSVYQTALGDDHVDIDPIPRALISRVETNDVGGAIHQHSDGLLGQTQPTVTTQQTISPQDSESEGNLREEKDDQDSIHQPASPPGQSKRQEKQSSSRKQPPASKDMVAIPIVDQKISHLVEDIPTFNIMDEIKHKKQQKIDAAIQKKQEKFHRIPYVQRYPFSLTTAVWGSVASETPMIPKHPSSSSTEDPNVPPPPRLSPSEQSRTLPAVNSTIQQHMTSMFHKIQKVITSQRQKRKKRALRGYYGNYKTTGFSVVDEFSYFDPSDRYTIIPTTSYDYQTLEYHDEYLKSFHMVDDILKADNTYDATDVTDIERQNIATMNEALHAMRERQENYHHLIEQMKLKGLWEGHNDMLSRKQHRYQQQLHESILTASDIQDEIHLRREYTLALQMVFDKPSLGARNLAKQSRLIHGYLQQHAYLFAALYQQPSVHIIALLFSFQIDLRSQYTPWLHILLALIYREIKQFQATRETYFGLLDDYRVLLSMAPVVRPEPILDNDDADDADNGDNDGNTTGSSSKAVAATVAAGIVPSNTQDDLTVGSDQIQSSTTRSTPIHKSEHVIDATLTIFYQVFSHLRPYLTTHQDQLQRDVFEHECQQLCDSIQRARFECASHYNTTIQLFHIFHLFLDYDQTIPLTLPHHDWYLPQLITALPSEQLFSQQVTMLLRRVLELLFPSIGNTNPPSSSPSLAGDSPSDLTPPSQHSRNRYETMIDHAQSIISEYYDTIPNAIHDAPPLGTTSDAHMGEAYSLLDVTTSHPIDPLTLAVYRGHPPELIQLLIRYIPQAQDKLELHESMNSSHIIDSMDDVLDILTYHIDEAHHDHIHQMYHHDDLDDQLFSLRLYSLNRHREQLLRSLDGGSGGGNPDVLSHSFGASRALSPFDSSHGPTPLTTSTAIAIPASDLHTHAHDHSIHTMSSYLPHATNSLHQRERLLRLETYCYQQQFRHGLVPGHLPQGPQGRDGLQRPPSLTDAETPQLETNPFTGDPNSISSTSLTIAAFETSYQRTSDDDDDDQEGQDDEDDSIEHSVEYYEDQLLQLDLDTDDQNSTHAVQRVDSSHQASSLPKSELSAPIDSSLQKHINVHLGDGDDHRSVGPETSSYAAIDGANNVSHPPFFIYATQCSYIASADTQQAAVKSLGLMWKSMGPKFLDPMIVSPIDGSNLVSFAIQHLTSPLVIRWMVFNLHIPFQTHNIFDQSALDILLNISPFSVFTEEILLNLPQDERVLGLLPISRQDVKPSSSSSLQGSLPWSNNSNSIQKISTDALIATGSVSTVVTSPLMPLMESKVEILQQQQQDPKQWLSRIGTGVVDTLYTVMSSASSAATSVAQYIPLVRDLLPNPSTAMATATASLQTATGNKLDLFSASYLAITRVEQHPFELHRDAFIQYAIRLLKLFYSIDPEFVIGFVDQNGNNLLMACLLLHKSLALVECVIGLYRDFYENRYQKYIRRQQFIQGLLHSSTSPTFTTTANRKVNNDRGKVHPLDNDDEDDDSFYVKIITTNPFQHVNDSGESIDDILQTITLWSLFIQYDGGDHVDSPDFYYYAELFSFISSCEGLCTPQIIHQLKEFEQFCTQFFQHPNV